jgi:glycosyltransferase involved in cell wall biosynthesis
LTKYLSQLGHKVTILTSTISGTGPIQGAAEVVRTADLMASSLNWRRRHFAALTGRESRDYSQPSRVQAAIVPDLALITWVPIATMGALRLARSDDYDVVITTSPPPSAHLVGRAVRSRGIRWIAELRDGWTFEPPHAPWPLALQCRADRALERLLLKRADAVVAVTEPIVQDLRRRLLVDAWRITNGFDPEEIREGKGSDPLLDPKRHSIVHTGRLALARSSPKPLLDGLRILAGFDPAAAARIELVFAGPLSQDERELMTAQDVASFVRVAGPLERERALRLQREADTLVVITEGSSRRSVATGKLFEYLAAARPVLVLGDETEAARIVNETGSGFATSADDPKAIADALRRVAVGDVDIAGRKGVEAYSYERLAEEYVRVIDSICS